MKKYVIVLIPFFLLTILNAISLETKPMLGGHVLTATVEARDRKPITMFGGLELKDIKTFSILNQPLIDDIFVCYATAFEKGELWFPCNILGRFIHQDKYHNQFISYPILGTEEADFFQMPIYRIVVKHVQLLDKDDEGYKIILTNRLMSTFWSIFYVRKLEKNTPLSPIDIPTIKEIIDDIGAKNKVTLSINDAKKIQKTYDWLNKHVGNNVIDRTSVLKKIALQQSFYSQSNIPPVIPQNAFASFQKSMPITEVAEVGSKMSDKEKVLKATPLIINNPKTEMTDIPNNQTEISLPTSATNTTKSKEVEGTNEPRDVKNVDNKTIIQQNTYIIQNNQATQEKKITVVTVVNQQEKVPEKGNKKDKNKKDENTTKEIVDKNGTLDSNSSSHPDVNTTKEILDTNKTLDSNNSSYPDTNATMANKKDENTTKEIVDKNEVLDLNISSGNETNFIFKSELTQ